MMTLQEILGAKEGHHFEFKEAKNRFGAKEAAEYLCAISNHGGGRLVLGVSDKRPRKVVGSKAFEQPESSILYFMDKLRVRCDFEIYHDENGKRVLVFEVASRPVGLPVQFDGTAWWREGERLVPMPESVRRTIYAESGEDFSGHI
jgi:ATP-dependent DNA helicase RecG